MRHMRMMLSRYTLLALFALMLVTAVGCDGCEDEETFTVIDTSQSDDTTTATASVEIEDAGAGGAGGSGGSAPEPKKVTTPIDPFRISKCCAALRTNKPTAPAAQHVAYDMAITACDAARKNPAALYQVKKLLPTAPPICQ